MTRFARLACATLAATFAAEPAEALTLDQPAPAQGWAAAEEVVAPARDRASARGPRPTTFEWTATLMGGGYRGPVPRGDAVALELGVGLGWANFALGLRGSMGVMGRESDFGLRSGVTFLQSNGRYGITLGVMARRVESVTVSYQTTDCVAIYYCGTGSKTATYGGAMVGAYLTFTSQRPYAN